MITLSDMFGIAEAEAREQLAREDADPVIQAKRAARMERLRAELAAMPDEPEDDPFDSEGQEDDDSGWDECGEDE